MRIFVPLISAIAIASLMPVAALAQQPPQQNQRPSQQGPAKKQQQGAPKSTSKNTHGGGQRKAPAGKPDQAHTGQPAQKQPAARPPQNAPGHHSQGPGHGTNDWRRQGGRLPDGRGRVVSDYSRYHLAPPPAGYRWVQDGNDFLLAAAATGIITSIIIGSQN
ncbi:MULTISPECIES: RcnB family protein [unclassified Xanthobacter]|uniref:RcnB family protein n=1 Tax=unclassified Xanthobacter TaxID=2623496 RepID=UPI001EDE30BA|nr:MULTISPECIES: RcnB family protein [unclassified Xanthobacter]